MRRLKIDPTSVLRAAKARPAARGRNGEDLPNAYRRRTGRRGDERPGSPLSMPWCPAGGGDSWIGSRKPRPRESLLESLDELRLDLLSGRIPQSRLETLRDSSQSLAAGGESQPALLGVLAEIETRWPSSWPSWVGKHKIL